MTVLDALAPRSYGVKIKHSPVRAVVEGKRLVVVEDSIGKS